MPLGLLPGMRYVEAQGRLEPSDSLLLYSDGIVEAHNVNKEMFGFPHLHEVVAGQPPGHNVIKIWALAADTDGIDGNADSAGAILLPDSLQRATAMAMVPREYLAANRSRDFFAALDDLLVTGPTGTNAIDLRILLVG